MMLFRAPLLAFALTASAASAQGGDPAAGAAVFSNNCAFCHVAKAGARPTAAPNLFGIGGTTSGVGDFSFTAALKNAKIKWTAQSLERFLTSPTTMVPGTRMITSVDDSADRANVVAYLLSLKKN